MSTQVVGSVNELEGPVSIMRDGEACLSECLGISSLRCQLLCMI